MVDLVLPVAVELDVPVTRRLRVHAVFNGDGVQIHHERDIANVFDWLCEMDVSSATFRDHEYSFHVNFQRLPEAPETKEG